MKSLRISALVALALLVAGSAFAASADAAGTNLFGVQLTNGTADLYSENGDHYITAYDHSELGVGFQVWHFMSADYAMNLTANFGFFSETDKPGNSAPVGSPDFKYTQNSYSVRVGGDRVVSLGERTRFYFGPGLEYWSGKAKFDDGTAAGTFETENVSRISVSGRVGGMMKLNDKVSFNCQVGRKLGYASATDKDRKATWWPSSFDASGGLVFGLGK